MRPFAQDVGGALLVEVDHAGKPILWGRTDLGPSTAPVSASADCGLGSERCTSSKLGAASAAAGLASEETSGRRPKNATRNTTTDASRSLLKVDVVG